MRALFAAAALLALAAPAHAADACHLSLASRMDMSVGDRASVPLTIAGQRVEFLIDTGGAYSMLSDERASSLNLKRYRADTAQVSMWGGALVNQFVTARDVALGDLKTPEMSFLVLPKGHLEPGIDGILAPDVLRAYDDDFDFANGRFSLFSPDHCPGKVVYWAKDWSEIGFDLDDGGHIRLPVTLDGHPVTVTMDTGSPDTVMSLELAESLLGFDERSSQLKRIETEDGSAAYRYPIAALSFGGVTVSHPEVVLIPDSVSHAYSSGRALLGMGVLRQLHLYIAYHEKKLYVTAASAHL
jgi:predicted aspartyl protease